MTQNRNPGIGTTNERSSHAIAASACSPTTVSPNRCQRSVMTLSPAQGDGRRPSKVYRPAPEWAALDADIAGRDVAGRRQNADSSETAFDLLAGAGGVGMVHLDPSRRADDAAHEARPRACGAASGTALKGAREGISGLRGDEPRLDARPSAWLRSIECDPRIGLRSAPATEHVGVDRGGRDRRRGGRGLAARDQGDQGEQQCTFHGPDGTPGARPLNSDRKAEPISKSDCHKEASC